MSAKHTPPPCMPEAYLDIYSSYILWGRSLLVSRVCVVTSCGLNIGYRVYSISYVLVGWGKGLSSAIEVGGNRHGDCISSPLHAQRHRSTWSAWATFYRRGISVARLNSVDEAGDGHP